MAMAARGRKKGGRKQGYNQNETNLLTEDDVTGEEAHCRMCEAPDEYVGELMAFVRGVAADSNS